MIGQLWEFRDRSFLMGKGGDWWDLTSSSYYDDPTPQKNKKGNER